MTCLETTFLVDLIKGKKEILSLLAQFKSSKDSITIASPSIMELWSGAAQHGYPSNKRERILALCNALEVLSLDATSAQEAGEIEAALIMEGKTLPPEDIMIAAIAKVNNQTLVTRDNHFTRIPGLRVLKY